MIILPRVFFAMASYQFNDFDQSIGLKDLQRIPLLFGTAWFVKLFAICRIGRPEKKALKKNDLFCYTRLRLRIYSLSLHLL